jgi:hypothetical protein
LLFFTSNSQLSREAKQQKSERLHRDCACFNKVEIMEDIFFIYVSKDKAFVEALIDALKQQRIEVIDGRLGLGDSLSHKVRQGLQQASYVILILSPAFFEKSWPRFEFEQVDKFDREFEGDTKLVPVWHDIDQQKVAYFAPELAQRLGVSSRVGLAGLVAEISEAVQKPDLGSSTFQTPVDAYPVSKSIPSSQNSMLLLRNNLNNYFSESELRSLCFDLAVDYENLAGSTKNIKIQELITFMQRRGRLSELTELARGLRPHVSW